MSAKKLLGRWEGAVEGARRDTLDGSILSHPLHAGVALLCGADDDSILQRLAEWPESGHFELDVSALGARLLLGKNGFEVSFEKYEGEALNGRALRALKRKVNIVALALALIDGDEGKIGKERESLLQTFPAFWNAISAPLELLSLQHREFLPEVARAIRLDLAEAICGWLGAEEAIVAVAIALVLNERDSQKALDWLKGSFADILERIYSEEESRALVSRKIGSVHLSVKDKVLARVCDVGADEPVDFSYWFVVYELGWLSELVGDILDGSVSLKEIEGSRATRKKLQELLRDPEFTVALRMPEAEKVLTPVAQRIVQSRLQALGEWMRTVHGEAVRCQFRFIAE